MASEARNEMGFFEHHRAKIALAGPDECWLWTASTDDWGYGVVRARGKTRKAHREAYEDENGQGSAGGLIVRHRCDTPPCVNPDHLVIGTTADNNRDMVERGRHVAPKGEASGNSKLTETDVQTIRLTYVRGCRDHGQYALARRFGVSRTTIGQIIRRELWAHI